jgi:NCS1 family nucleobase:cation symporter-1
VLGALIGPLFGILIADFYLIRKQKIVVDDLFTMDPKGEYHYTDGYNVPAITALIGAGVLSIASVVLPKLLGVAGWISDYSWFIGCGVGFVLYHFLAKRANIAGSATPATAEAETVAVEG